MKNPTSKRPTTLPRLGSLGSRTARGQTRPSPQVDSASRKGRRRSRQPILFATVVATFLMLGGLSVTAQTDPFATERHDMVNEQIRKRGVTQPGVLKAMESVPRHLFVPESKQTQAYQDGPIAFAPGKNLSHALVSARMLELLDLSGGERVLEIGTGSGYDAALLSRVASKVYTIEIDRKLGDHARQTLERLGFDNIEVRIGDGFEGWPEKAPFDAILVTVSTDEPPPPLYEQLAMDGKMVVAVGSLVQEMKVITKTPEGPVIRSPRRLVNLRPMTRERDRE